MKLLGFIATLFVSLALSNAYAVYSEADGTDGDLPIIKSQKNGSSSAYWLTGSLWGDGLPPHPGADYVIMSNQTQFVNGSTTFEGHSLQVGTTDYKLSSSRSVGKLNVYARESGFVRFEGDGLILVNGSAYLRYYKDTLIEGKVTVLSNAAHPFELYNNETDIPKSGVPHDPGYFRFQNKVSGPATAVLKVTGKAARDNVKGFGLKAADDWTDYLGTIIVTAEVNTVGTYHPLGSLNPAELVVTNTTIGGSVVLHDGTTLSSLVDGEPFGIGNLTLKAGSTVKLTGDLALNSLSVEGDVTIILPSLAKGTPPKITVAETATISGGKLHFVSSGDPGSAGIDSPILDLPAGSAISPEDVEYEATAVYPGEIVPVVDEQTGRKSFKLHYRPIVALLHSDNGGRTSEQLSSLTNAAFWSDLREPHDKAAYVSTNNNLRIYDTLPCSQYNAATLDYVFPGESYTMVGSAQITFVSRSARFKRLIVAGNNSISSCAYAQPAFHGPIEIRDSSSLKFAVGYNKTLTCDSTIAGSGSLTMSALGGGTSSTPAGALRLTALNTGFTGTIRVTIPDGGEGDRETPQFNPTKNKYATLYVADKLNFGGPLTAFNPKALTIEQMSRLAVDPDVSSVTLDEPTRGIFISGCGRFFVDTDKTMTVASPLAVDGTLWKEGDGTLVLANPAPTFGADATATEPVGDSTNLMFCVTGGGDVCLAAVDAVNGLDLFATNFTGRLVFDLSAATEGDFAAYGVRNVKTDAPFASFDDGQIVCVVEPPDNVKDGDSFPVLTVKGEAAGDLASRNLLDFVRSDTLKDLHFVMTVAPRDNGDGTTTLMATVART